MVLNGSGPVYWSAHSADFHNLQKGEVCRPVYEGNNVKIILELLNPDFNRNHTGEHNRLLHSALCNQQQ